MASPFKGSNHIQPPDHEGPIYWECLESGRGHMTLIGEELAADTMLDKVLCVCSGCRRIKPSAEGLANKGPSCGVVPAESGMNFSQKVPPFLFRDTPLKDSGCAFLIKLSLVDFIGFRSPHYAACLILVLGELLPKQVGEEWFCPRGNYCHYFVG